MKGLHYFFLFFSYLANISQASGEIIDDLPDLFVKGKNLNLVNSYTKETNSLMLDIKEFQVADSKSHVMVASDFSGENIFAADRGNNKISRLKFNAEKQSLSFTEQFSVPNQLENNNQAKPAILDLHYSNFSNKLYASVFYHYEEKHACSKLLVYEISNSKNDQNKSFKKIFESTPCVSIPRPNNSEVCARLATSRKSLYISGGNILMDLYNVGFPNPSLCCFDSKLTYEDLVSLTNLFGSVVKVDMKSLKSIKISTGHRIPQGLVYDDKRNILWETEHGPRGGDELNNIKEGANYGWPYESLGLPYDNKWSQQGFKTKFNSLGTYNDPIFAWLPSVGISQLTYIKEGSSFDDFWSGDLIISSLKDTAIYRVKLNSNNNVIYTERVSIGKRIRDIEINKNFLLISTDGGTLFTLSPSKQPISIGSFSPN